MKRVTAGILLGLALILVPAGLASAVDAFPDVPAGSSYYTSITDLASRNIVFGYDDGTFGPDDPVIRQQFAKMIVKTLGIQVTGNEISPFTDVPSAVAGASDPFYPDKYVTIVYQRGWIEPSSPTAFGPRKSLTRAELATAAARALSLPDPPAGYTPPFDTFPGDGYTWARRAAYAGLLTGLQGMGPGFDFLQSASRAECAQVLHNLLALLPPGNASTTSSSASSTSSETLPTGQSSTTTSVAPGSTTETSAPGGPLGSDGGFPTPLVAGIVVAVIVALAAALFFILRAGSWRRQRVVQIDPSVKPGATEVLDEEARRLLLEWAAELDEALAAAPIIDENSRLKELWEDETAPAKEAEKRKGSPSAKPKDAGP